MSQPLPETPLDALGEMRRERVLILDRSFTLEVPVKPDAAIDHPAVRATFAADDYLPYWSEIWPASRMLAKAVLREPWPAELLGAGERPGVLELGCGLGLAGIAALARGMRVVFSDCDRTAVRLAERNARLNGFGDFRTLAFDWREPPAGLSAAVVLGADLTYEARHVGPVVECVAAALAPGGVCLLTDPDRKPAEALRRELSERGLRFTATPTRAGAPGGDRVKGTLYRITRE